ncbi:MAG: hypothetical protein PVG14_09425 [Anaerolineales bacterium]
MAVRAQRMSSGQPQACCSQALDDPSNTTQHHGFWTSQAQQLPSSSPQAILCCVAMGRCTPTQRKRVSEWPTSNQFSALRNRFLWKKREHKVFALRAFHPHKRRWKPTNGLATTPGLAGYLLHAGLKQKSV